MASIYDTRGGVDDTRDRVDDTRGRVDYTGRLLSVQLFCWLANYFLLLARIKEVNKEVKSTGAGLFYLPLCYQLIFQVYFCYFVRRRR